jgi:tetratricopeptide (TPR) repeat protein
MYQVYVCHAISYSDAGETDKAIEKYKEAINVEPQAPNAYILLGNIYAAQKKHLEALDCYKKASELQPENAKTYTFIGNTYFMLNDLENAIYTYRSALHLDECSVENKLVYIEIVQEYINRKEANKK